MNRSVLVLDDDPFILSLLAVIFARRGYDVISFTNPLSCPLHSAKTCPCPFETHCPNIILTDYDMPGANGLEFLESLRQKKCRCPHVALMTGSQVDDAVLQRVAQLGVKLIAKPFHPDQIYAWLNTVEAA